MRMWMVDPKLMCNKHLLGEHVETHMFRSVLASKLGVDGYLANNLLEPQALKLRHDALAAEMERRGMNHQSPLEPVSIEYLTGAQQACKVDVDVSYRDLLYRCPRCQVRYEDQFALINRRQQ